MIPSRSIRARFLFSASRPDANLSAFPPGTRPGLLADRGARGVGRKGGAMGGRPGDDGKDGPEGFRAYLRFLHLGTQLAVTLLLGVLGGLWLDRTTGSSPLFTVAGSLLGIVFGLGAVILEVGRRKR